ncbi:hypothetical protein ACFQ1Q_12785 [Winogradskyella litorisediminis]|uniref:Uncharacterized protein n=1 Tax=Winogradskyella litorisediminis TaxID=1156618 RepID=A0ABW3N9G4_9FLAO
MSCILIIEGKKFDVDGFLEITKMQPYEKHFKGEKRPFKKEGKQLVYEKNGCRFELSNADFNDFEAQRRDTIKFLNKNFKKLKSIYSFGLKITEVPTISFGIENQMADFWCQTEFLQPELLKLSGDLHFGIEISLYHPAVEND